jgi:hypothetical protein
LRKTVRHLVGFNPGARTRPPQQLWFYRDTHHIRPLLLRHKDTIHAGGLQWVWTKQPSRMADHQAKKSEYAQRDCLCLNIMPQNVSTPDLTGEQQVPR